MNRAFTVVERALHHDRLLVIAGLLMAVTLSWAYLWSGAGTMEEMGDMLMPMSSGPWTIRHALVMLVMWAVMMVAMMLPSAAPMILLYATIARNGQARGESAAGSGLFVLGYVGVWSVFSVLAVMLQFTLEKLALLSPMMETTSTALAGTVLVAAGLYQWTPFKQACLRRCRSPLEFVLMHWRSGPRGAFLMGWHHGLYCVGCCWLLMLLLFIGGVMNLSWIAGLAVFVLVEKLAPAGHWISLGSGAVLIGWGALTLFPLT